LNVTINKPNPHIVRFAMNCMVHCDSSPYKIIELIIFVFVL